MGLSLYSSSIITTDIKDDELLDKFYLGRSFFTIPWVEAPSATTARDGLGPLFNANTCTTCHIKNTKGRNISTNSYINRSLIVKLSIPRNGEKSEFEKTNGFLIEPKYGSQIQISAVFGVKEEAKIRVEFDKKQVTYPDGKVVKLTKPRMIFEELNYGEFHKNTNISPRYTPSLFGMGLIEKIKDEDILAYENLERLRKYGIKGKANIVFSKLHQKMKLGKFNHKASMASLIEQSALAANEDMGLTNPFYTQNNCTKFQKDCMNAPEPRDLIDINYERLEAISVFLANLKMPKSKPEPKGKKLFSQVGCVNCHRDNFIVENKQIKPYSDFLLHDMGSEFDDGRAEFKAKASQWRTIPLWGMRKVRNILKDDVRFLHDGRAKSVEEAILWHDGEARAIRDTFMNLKESQRKLLIKFVENLWKIY